MSISSSEKIFIDPREEITFIVERLLKADKDRIILVVPQNSLLLSSLVSIDILFRKLVRTKKISVIVTEDEYGKAIASKAGFVVVDKVSHITNEQWNLANNRKLNVKEILDERKKALLANISGESRDLQDLPEIPGTEADEFEVTESELDEVKEDEIQTIEDVTEEMLVKPYEDPIIETEIIEDVPQVLAEEAAVEEVKAPSKEDLEKQELETSLKRYAKPRREVKELDLGGIKLVSGGDIKNYIDSKESAKMTDSNSFTQMSDETNFDRKIKKVGSSSFTGKDFTKKVADKGGIKSLLGKLSFKRRNADFRDENDFIKKKNRRKVLIASFLVFLLLFSIGGYVFAFQLSTVDVTLTLRAQDVSTSATVLISKTADELSLESPITIPAKEYTLEATNLSISKTGTADGKGERGAKAKGLVTFYNLTTEDVVLPVGIKLTNTTNNLVYVTLSEVSMPAKTSSGGVIDPGSEEDISIEADGFGTNYNLDLPTADNKTTTVFSIEGYDRATEISATSFGDLTGGTKEEFVSVSQENFDKLKETIVPDLKKQGLERLKALTESGYQLIEGTVTYDESTEPQSLPKVGEEAKDRTFNLTVQIGIKGLAVKTSDLTEAVSTVLKSNAQGTNGNTLQVDDIMNPVIDKVEANGDDFVVTVSSKGSVKTEITPEQMKKDIAGFTIQQANDYFRLIDYIQDYKVSFNPDLLPDGLKRVPTDTSRITIKTR